MAKPKTKEIGTIYVLHFSRPLHHAKHYVGWTKDLVSRIGNHKMGSGAKIMAACREAGIDFTVVKTMPGTRDDERRIHNQKNTKRLCPYCDIRR